MWGSRDPAGGFPAILLFYFLALKVFRKAVIPLEAADQFVFLSTLFLVVCNLSVFLYQET